MNSEVIDAEIMMKYINEAQEELLLGHGLINDFVDYRIKIVISALKEEEPEIIKLFVPLIESLIINDGIYINTYILSALADLTGDALYLERLLEKVISSEELTCANQNFIATHTRSMVFMKPSLGSLRVEELQWKLLKKAVEGYKRLIDVDCHEIPKQERHENQVLIITDQLLNENHGPTKTTLARYYVLCKKINKKVFLINSGEILTQRGEIPFYKRLEGNRNSNLDNISKFMWKDISVDFLQCPEGMPSVSTLTDVLTFVRDLKPGYIISIGGESLLSNIVADMAPSLSIGLCPSKLCHTLSKYQQLSKVYSEEDEKLLELVGKDTNCLIEGVFTSDIMEATGDTTKQTLGVREDEKIIAVVGGRLDAEVDNAFLDVLEKSITDDCVVIFFGIFKKFDKFVSRYERLAKQSRYFEAYKDMVGALKISYLYVNPKRRGGGTSSVEALSCGIPAVSTNFGDVAANVGKDFVVNDYEEMACAISRYLSDEDYYRTMSTKAIERSKKLLNTEEEFVNLFLEFESRG